MKIYLVRHGETPWNEEMRYQGQTDVPLSERGRKQADALREAHFKAQGSRDGVGFSFAKVYSSDLKRALETAKIIVAGSDPTRKEIMLCKELREINYGVFEGVLLEDIKRNYAEILQQWWRDPQKARIPQGESLEELKERVLHCYHNIVESHKETDDNILIVSHGGPLRIIFMDVLEFSLSQARSFRVDNTSLSIVEYKNSRPVLTLLNDICHLEQNIDSRL